MVKSDWLERLGGRTKVEACASDELGSVRIKRTKSGLKLLNANTDKEDGSEDDSDEGDEDEEEEDEEEEENMEQGV